MSLRRQLLIASLLLLTLPWAGCQFVREMEGSLRQGQEQALQATSTAVAAVLRGRPELLYPYPQRLLEETGDNKSLYAYPMEQAIIIDGYDDGWEELNFQSFESNASTSPTKIHYKAATRRGRLYLFLQVQDDDVVFHNPGLSREPNGDRLILRTWLDNRRQEYVIATSAPGKVSAQYKDKIVTRGSASRIRGQWQDTATGYNLELEIPLSLTGGRLGFYIINARANAGGGFETLGNATPMDTAPPPWLIYSPAPLQQAIAPFEHGDRQIQIIDKGRWLLANIASLRPTVSGNPAEERPEETFWLLRTFYRSILSRDAPLVSPPTAQAGQLNGEAITAVISGAATNSWYNNPDDPGRTLLSAATPIRDGKQVIGAVLVRQSSEEYLSLTDQAFSRLLGYSLLALAVGTLGLLGFASLLSWRIRKLSLAASNIVREDGSLGNDFPVSKAADEIGELSRHYAQMLDKLREYNDYLRTLSSKLSHELRTPIAVIETSLENLEHSNAEPETKAVYVTRAREGLARLNKILTAMSEANRLEESIHNNTLERVNLVPLLEEVFTVYQGLYKHAKLKFKCNLTEAVVYAVPELIVQALDKLMDNAASFCPDNGQIIVVLHRNEDTLQLHVSNDGPTLPEELKHRLFDSMVSLREGGSADVHLGLGLYIARLIAEFHGGHVHAKDRLNGNGVTFTITLPCTDKEEAS